MPASKRTPGDRSHSRLDPARVVGAACTIADERGLDAVTLSAVAQALGVRTPSLYNHVDGLDALRRGVALRGVTGLGGALRDAAVGRSGPDALEAMAHAYRAYAVGHPGRYAATQRTGYGDDEALRQAAAATVDVVYAVLRPWGRSGDDLVHTTRVVRSALHGFVALELDAGFGLDADPDVSFARLIGVLVAGLDAGA